MYRSENMTNESTLEKLWWCQTIYRTLRLSAIAVSWLSSETIVEARFCVSFDSYQATLQTVPCSPFWVQLAQHTVWQDVELFPGTVLCRRCDMALTCHTESCGLILWMFSACRHQHSVAGGKKTAVCIFIFTSAMRRRGGEVRGRKHLERCPFL